MVRLRIHIRHKLTSPAAQRRLAYVLNFLQQHPFHPEGVRLTNSNIRQGDCINIFYENESAPKHQNTFLIPAQNLFFAATSPPLSKLIPNTYTFRQQQLYSVELKPQPTPAFLQDHRFGFDIFETLFFHLSRYEEQQAGQQQLDEWDMMRTDQQFLSKHRLHQQPVVDQLVLAFYQALGFPSKLPAPQLILTHDIDMVKKFDQPLRVLRHLTVLLLYRRLPVAFGRTLSDWWATLVRGKTDPYDNFEWLLSPSEHFHRKVIYFMAGGDSRYDHPYDLFSKRMQAVFQLAKDRGYQLGIHPSYNCWKDEKQFKKEWELLCEATGEDIRYTRQHYLHFSWAHTPRIIESLGLEDDSTMGYNHCTGYRCGTGFSYSLYNFVEERAYRFTETPLVVMDSSVVNEGRWRKEEVEKIWERWLGKDKEEGQLCFNFHNMYMDSYGVRGMNLGKYLNQLNQVH